MSSERREVDWLLQLMVAIVLLSYEWAGGSRLVVGPAAVLLLLSPWIRWRYHPSKRLGEWLYVLVAMPFLLIGVLGDDAGARLVGLSTVFLLCLAVQEEYRDATTRKSLVVHLALLGVLFHAGYSYELKAYPGLVAVYLSALVLWCRRQTGPSSRGTAWGRAWIWLGVGVATALVVLVAGGLFLYLPHAERQLTGFYQKLMTADVQTLMGPVRESELGSLGPMFSSTSVIARFFGPNPQLLRAHVLVTYAHNHWKPEDEAATLLATDPRDTPLQDPVDGPLYHYGAPPPKGPSLVGDIVEDGFNTILAPYGTWALRTGVGGVRADPYGVLQSVGLLNALEARMAWAPAATADVTGAAADQAAYLSVPDDMKAEIGSLARRVVGMRSDPVAQADAIKIWLDEHCTYELSPRGEGDRDRLETFLFSNHQGYCEYFASAMALMLRSLGVRTRYVLGYLVREKNAIGGYWTVRARDAHAWVEVYLPGRGWSVWDPTPPAELEAFPGSASWVTQLSDQYGLWFARFWASVHSGNWKALLRAGLAYVRELVVRVGTWLGLPAGLVLLGFALWRWRPAGHAARQKRSAVAVSDPHLKLLRAALQRVERRLQRQGFVRLGHETLAEFSGRVEDNALGQLVQVYCGYRYGAHPLEPETETLLRSWR